VIDHLGLSRMAVLLVVALVIFGPEKLPEIASQIGRTLRKFRGTLNSMSSELRATVGPEMADLDLKSLHPKNFMADLMADEEPKGHPVDPTPDGSLPPAPIELPSGSDAMTLLHAPLDLSTVEQELASFESAPAQP